MPAGMAFLWKQSARPFQGILTAVPKTRMKSQIDRRTYPRFEVVHRAIAELGKFRTGRITDISKGGLAFHYFDFSHKEGGAFDGLLLVNAVNHVGFFSFNLLCRVIMDDFTQSETSHSHYLIRIKKCCVQFEWMTPEKKSQLDYFISNFTNAKNQPH